jgi:hypothetical protein
MGPGVSEGPLSGILLENSSSTSSLAISSRAAAAEISASEISAADRHRTISHTIHLRDRITRYFAASHFVRVWH